MSTPDSPSQNERTWGMLAHLSAFFGLLTLSLFIGSIIAPLVIWLIRRDQSAFIADQAKEALNFNITIAIGAVICLVLMLAFIGVLLGIALGVYWFVMTIVAAIQANQGIAYRYPFALRLVK